MEKFFVVVIIVLAVLAVGQLARVYDLTRHLRGKREEDITHRDNKLNANLMIVFMVLFYAGFIYLMIAYGSGLPVAASEHGETLDFLLNFNWVIVIAVFFLCNTLLFVFAWKFYYREDRKALYFPHNNRLELLWTVVPALFLAVIIIYGLQAWQEITDVDAITMDEKSEDYDGIVMELYSKQFDWTARYAGKDNELGDANYLMIPDNPLGLVHKEGICAALTEYQTSVHRAYWNIKVTDSLNYFDVKSRNCEAAMTMITNRSSSTRPVFSYHMHDHGHDDHADHGMAEGDGHEDHADDHGGGHGHGVPDASALIATEMEELGNVDPYMAIWLHELEEAGADASYEDKMAATDHAMAMLQEHLDHFNAKQEEFKAGVPVKIDGECGDLHAHKADDEGTFTAKVMGEEKYADTYENYRKYQRLVNRVYAIMARCENGEYNGGDLDYVADDVVVSGEFYLPIGREVLFRMRSQDVIHSAYMPHFRAQMNTVPGMVTQFRFTPTITTEEMRANLGNDDFDYILLCNKICGSNHYNMQMKIKVVSEEEFEAYMNTQSQFNGEDVVAYKLPGSNGMNAESTGEQVATND